MWVVVIVTTVVAIKVALIVGMGMQVKRLCEYVFTAHSTHLNAAASARAIHARQAKYKHDSTCHARARKWIWDLPRTNCGRGRLHMYCNYSYCSTGTHITGMGWGYVVTPITSTISSLVHKWHIKSEPHPWYRGGYQTKSRLRVSLSLTHMLTASWYSGSKIQTLNIRLFTQKIVIFHNGKM